MDSLIILGACLAIVILFIWSKPGIIIYFRQPLIALACLAFILCLVFFSDTAVKAAAKGANLWFSIVLPSLFPFFVASEVLNSTGFVKASGILFEPAMRPLFNVPGCGSFAFAMGISSGYPVGARITTEMRLKGLISKIEAERLLSFTNNSGPLFIIGAVAVGMYNMPSLGIFLWVCHILACVTVGLLFRFYKREQKHTSSAPAKVYKNSSAGQNKKNNSGGSLGTILGDAVRNSVMLLLAIGGFIILFSVIINLLLETGVIKELAEILAVLSGPFGISKEAMEAILCGFFEITTGTNLASGLKNVQLPLQLAVTSMIIGWAGLSVHSQVLSITSSTDISIKPYLFGKFLQGLFAALYTWVGFKLFGTLLLEAQPVFSPSTNPGTGLNLTSYIFCFISCIGVLAIFYLLALLVSRLFKNENKVTD